MTILNIRATNGAGKTTLVRRLMEAAPGPREMIRRDIVGAEEAKTNAVIGYHWPEAGFVVFGVYETPTGGCDNFSLKGVADWVMETVLDLSKLGNVVFEGVLISMYGPERWSRLHRLSGDQVRIIELTTPKEICAASIEERQRERLAEKLRRRAMKKGKLKPLKELKPFNPELVYDKVNTIRVNTTRLVYLGIPVQYLDREAAFIRAKELMLCSESKPITSAMPSPVESIS